jgi:hypothetical protein
MEKLSKNKIAEIQSTYPGIPLEYLDWLAENGWGEHESGYMIYSNPTYSSEIFGSECPENIMNILMVGDDMAGYSIGFIKTNSSWQFVGIKSCGWEVEKISEGFSGYLKS